jgi:hypothetical protein
MIDNPTDIFQPHKLAKPWNQRNHFASLVSGLNSKMSNADEIYNGPKSLNRLNRPNRQNRLAGHGL